MPKFISVLVAGWLVAINLTRSISAEEENLAFEEVYKNAAPHKGKKITWAGRVGGIDTARVMLIANADRKGAGKTEALKIFVVEFPNVNAALDAVSGGRLGSAAKVTGIIAGETTIKAQVFAGKAPAKVKAPLIKLISYEVTEKK